MKELLSILTEQINSHSKFDKLLKAWDDRRGFDFNTSIYDDWHELSMDEKYEFLEIANITGIIIDKDSKNPEDSTFAEWGTILVSCNKRDLLLLLGDILMNLNEGYDVEDENHYIVAYKVDGKVEYIYTEDIEPGYYPSNKLPVKNLYWISSNQGLTDDIYWAKDKSAEADLMNYLGGSKYVNGKLQK